ncbi:MAG: SUMF1/EgtB/PvdO family nonheme iron enzyme [Planctomycetes bacterium]|nr:SUMF1/EgtB/PvdO family nonheme iron enzyme [Planctomycetota bacterium]
MLKTIGLVFAIVFSGATVSLAQQAAVFDATEQVNRVVDELSLFNTQAMERAIKDLAGRYPDRFDKAELLAELTLHAGQLKTVTAMLKQGNPAAVPAGQAMLDFKRRVLLANPVLDFDQIVAVQRIRPGTADKLDALCTQVGMTNNWLVNTNIPKAGWDNSIGKLSLDGTFEPLAASADFMGDLNLHFNADTVIYSSISQDNRTWQIFELNLTNEAIRQVTIGNHDDIDNFDACYLPEGKIIYASTAGFQGVPCIGGGGDIANLHVMNSDGTGIRRLTFDQESNWSPYLMDNGRIMYQRWEYTDLSHFWSRTLFSMNPDGTDQKAYYGSNSWWPNTLFYAKPVPGSPHTFTAIVSGHHGVQRAGQLVLFDAAKGRKDADGAVQALPGFGKPVEPIVIDEYYKGQWPKVLHPQPLSETVHLAAVKLNARDKFGIYLIDVFDNLLPLKRSQSHHYLEPIALRRRMIPPVIPERVDLNAKHAMAFISDIYTGPGLAGVPRGTVKKLRVFKFEFSPRGFGGHAQTGIQSGWDLKVILGSVDVEADGSAMFRIPSNTAISVQPLDAEGKALAIMRTWMTAMPGEVLSCVGCHESQNEAPPAKTAMASLIPPQTIQPWYGGTRGFSFLREVQPVLDQYCVGCHDGTAKERPNLADTKTDQFGDHNFMQNKMPKSYFDLQQFVRRPGPEGNLHLLTPLNYHADTSELIQMLAKGHHNVKLDKEAWDRLITWIDLNAPAHGSFSEMSPPASSKTFFARRADLYKEYATALEIESEVIHTPYEKKETFVAPEEMAQPAAAPSLANWPFQATPAGEAIEILDLGDGVFMECAPIPAGQFVMGSNHESPDEQPMQTVTIDTPFKMGVTEVTLAQYQQFAREHANGLYGKPGVVIKYGFSMDKASYPVIRVSWDQANAFCKWLSQKTEKAVSLPSEAQWEWACRAGTDTATSFGDTLTDYPGYANLSDPTSDNRRTKYMPTNHWTLAQKNEISADKAHCLNEVGAYKANAFGIKDMHGNAAEWTRSEFRPYPYAKTDGRNAMVTGRKVVRGGSWNDRPIRCTSTYRLSFPSWQRVYNVGFRIIIE